MKLHKPEYELIGFIPVRPLPAIFPMPQGCPLLHLLAARKRVSHNKSEYTMAATQEGSILVNWLASRNENLQN